MSWKDLVVIRWWDVIFALSFFTVLFINRAISVSLLTKAVAFLSRHDCVDNFFLKNYSNVFSIKGHLLL